MASFADILYTVRHRVWYRISSRITIIYLVTAILTTLAVIFALRTILPEHPRNQFARTLALYVIEQLGPAPSKDALEGLAQELGVGLMVLGPDGIVFSNRNHFPTPEFLRGIIAANERWQSFGFSDNYGKRFFLARKEDQYFVFSDFVKGLSVHGQLALIGALVGIFLILAISFWAVQKVIASVRPLHDAVGKIKAGNLKTRIKIRSHDEIGTLSHHFNGMAATLEEAERSKREFMIAIGHEFSSPIARIMFQCENIKDITLRNRIRKNLLQISTLFRTLVSVEVIDDPSVMNRSEPCDFPSIISDIVESVDGDNVDFDLPTNTKKILTSPIKLEILLSNFISNATRYAPNSRITVRACHEDDELIIQVLDRGPGAPQELVLKLTEPFTRVDTARQNKTGGIGLGLYLCEQITKNAGGRLSIENRSGGGLKITVVLPCPTIAKSQNNRMVVSR